MDSQSVEPPHSAPVIDCAAYADGRRVADLAIDQIRGALTRTDQFVWLGLYEPDQAILRQVQEQFQLHDLAIEDAYNAHQRPKLELYEDSLFVVLRTAQMVRSPAHMEFGETHVFVGPQLRRSRSGTDRCGRTLASAIAVNRRRSYSRRVPGTSLYSLMDFVVDQYLPIVAEIEEEVQELEDVAARGSLEHGGDAAHLPVEAGPLGATPRGRRRWPKSRTG